MMVSFHYRAKLGVDKADRRADRDGELYEGPQASPTATL